jgi:threonine aldolase
MIDLKSDTITKPTKGMLQAMFSAKVGDDVYKEDPTVNELEARLADMFGKKHALFFPSGSMANQAAIKLHTQPGEQLICDKWAHVFNYEGGGVSFNSGVSCKLIDGSRGKITAQQVEANINAPDFYHSPKSSLICIENTTNKGGGACYDLDELQAIQKVTKAHNLGYHLDGARLFNALVQKKQNALDFGNLFQTISVCLSKGLGAPVGSVLIGDDDVMENAMRVRKVLGGGMRQVGYLAAAGHYALDNHIERLEEDHIRAKEIESTLKELNYIKSVEPVETNIVIFYLDDNSSGEEFLNHLTERNIIISAMGEGKWRIVTHLDYTEEQHKTFIKALQDFK